MVRVAIASLLLLLSGCIPPGGALGQAPAQPYAVSNPTVDWSEDTPPPDFPAAEGTPTESPTP